MIPEKKTRKIDDQIQIAKSRNIFTTAPPSPPFSLPVCVCLPLASALAYLKVSL